MKDIHTYGEKMARNGRTKDIYKGTFICIQTLCFQYWYSGFFLGIATCTGLQCMLKDTCKTVLRYQAPTMFTSLPLSNFQSKNVIIADAPFQWWVLQVPLHICYFKKDFTPLCIKEEQHHKIQKGWDRH